MPYTPVLFKADIEKSNGPDGPVHWTNSYHIEAEDIYAANVSAQHIWQAEQYFHSDQVYFVKMRVSTVAEGDDVFISTPLNLLGVYEETGDLLPIFLAMRVDFVATVGRGGRKFYHPLVGEGEQAGAQWGLGLISATTTALDTLENLLSDASTPLTSPTGATTYNSFSVFTAITQHQFRRGSKRRVPILP